MNWFVAVAFGLKKFFEEGDPRDLFCLALDPPLGKYGQNIFMHVPGHEHFTPTKFHKHPLSSSVESLAMYSHAYTCISAPPFSDI